MIALIEKVRIMSFKSALKHVLEFSPYAYDRVSSVYRAYRDFSNRIAMWFIPLIPPGKRYTFARLMRFQYSSIAKMLDNIPEDQLAKIILFVSFRPIAREIRMAEATRLAGWKPILVYRGHSKYNLDQYFDFHGQAKSLFQMILVVWLFRGAVVHLFPGYGHLGYIFCVAKSRPVILNIYDPSLGINYFP
jgi:hypothetical protein